MLARIRKLDLSKPGGVEDLLEFHRQTFGPARMEDGDGDEGDGDGEDADEGDGKKATKKAAAKKTAAKKAAAGGDDDEGDGEDDAAEKQQKALTTERGKVRSATSVIARLTGKSKTEVARALRKGGVALDDLEADEDGSDDGDEPPAKKTAAKKSTRSEEQIRREADRDAEDKTNAKLVRSEVKALAARTFNNPRDAVNNLSLDDYEVDDDGDLVDPDKVEADLAALLKKHPHYARKKGPKSDRSQGGRGSGSGDRPKSMRDLSRMHIDED